MTADAVLKLLAALAEAFGLVGPEVIAWAQREAPELRPAPPPGEREAVDAEVDAEREARAQDPRA